MNSEKPKTNKGRIIYHVTAMLGGGGGFILSLLNLMWFMDSMKDIALDEEAKVLFICLFLLFNSLLTMGASMFLVLFIFYIFGMLSFSELISMLKNKIPDSL